MEIQCSVHVVRGNHLDVGAISRKKWIIYFYINKIVAFGILSSLAFYQVHQQQAQNHLLL